MATKTTKKKVVKKAPRKSAEKSLVIVESPAKANTIRTYLGSGYVVKASIGHIKGLPKSKLGIDVDKSYL